MSTHLPPPAFSAHDPSHYMNGNTAILPSPPYPSCCIRTRRSVFQFGVVSCDLLRLRKECGDSSIVATNSQSSIRLESFYHDNTHAPTSTSPQSRDDNSTLTYLTWLRQAKQHFSITSDVAKLYWQTFCCVHRRALIPMHSTAAIRMPTLSLTVDSQEFMIFLFLQQYRDMGKEEKCTNKEAEDYDSDEENDETNSNINTADQERKFLSDHMDSLVRLCLDSQNREAATSIKAHEFDRLAFILQGLTRPNEDKEIASLAALTPFFASSSSYPNDTTTVAIPTAVKWLRTQLNRPHLSLQLSMSMDTTDMMIEFSGGGATATNNAAATTSASTSTTIVKSIPLVPIYEITNEQNRSIFCTRTATEKSTTKQQQNGHHRGNRQLHLSASKSSLPSSSTTLHRTIPHGSHILLSHITHSTISLPLITRFLHCSHLTHCEVNLGVVTHQVVLEECCDCTVWIVLPSSCDEKQGGGVGCSMLKIRNCKNVTVYMYSHGVTQILDDYTDEGDNSDTSSTSSNITLSPYNTNYTELEDDLRSLGLVTENENTILPKNTWSSYVILNAPDEESESSSSHSSVVHLLSPDAFSWRSMPTFDGAPVPLPSSSSFPLPAEFITSLARRQAQFTSNRNLMQSAFSQLSPQQQELMMRIEIEFQTWLSLKA